MKNLVVYTSHLVIVSIVKSRRLRRTGHVANMV